MDILNDLNNLINKSEKDISDCNKIISGSKDFVSRKQIQLLTTKYLKEIKKYHNGKIVKAQRDIIWHSTSDYPLLICTIRSSKKRDNTYLDSIARIEIDACVHLKEVDKRLLEILKETFNHYIDYTGRTGYYYPRKDYCIE